MLYSKVDVLAFTIASVAVVLCSLAIKGMQCRSQEVWIRMKRWRRRGGMWGEVSPSQKEWGLRTDRAPP